MVKKSEQSEAKSTLNNTQAPVVIALTKSKMASLRGMWKRVPRRNKIIIIVCALALVVGVGFFIYQSQPKTVKLLTEEQATQIRLEKLKKNKPDAKASVADKKTYYRDLQFTNIDDGNYQGALDALKQLEVVDKKNFSHSDYMQMAVYYTKLKNKTEALKALDAAYAKLPPGINEDTGYVRDDVAKSINDFRAELNK